MRIHPADNPPKRGEICLKVLLETENVRMSLNIFADSEWNDGNRKNNDVYLQVPSESRQFRLLAL